MARVAVLGGAGFLGSHLCDRLVGRGDEVIAIDDLSSGSMQNIEGLGDSPNFSFVHADISEAIPIDGKIDLVLNFASPASPPRYSRRPIHTLRTGAIGTENALRLASANGARLLMASTSEVYGDPTEHPQRETYWGNVNPIGPRSCYDEAKRYAEALCVAFEKESGVDICIIRIFNTYGPRLDPADGRVVSNFISQALAGQPMTVYGDGSQTRSFCYVDDLINGVLLLADSGFRGPVNLGNPTETSMIQLAAMTNRVLGSDVPLVFQPLPQDDPSHRCPDISVARSIIGWEPRIPLEDGLVSTIDWFRHRFR